VAIGSSFLVYSKDAPASLASSPLSLSLHSTVLSGDRIDLTSRGASVFLEDISLYWLIVLVVVCILVACRIHGILSDRTTVLSVIGVRYVGTV
jgi:hypothetical protein